MGLAHYLCSVSTDTKYKSEASNNYQDNITYNKTFKLTADIDLNPGLNMTEIGQGNPGYWEVPNVWPTLDGFAGTFDGQGHAIYGLYKDNTSQVGNYTGVGFIARWYGGGDVKNLVFDNAWFYSTSAGDSLGLIAGIKSHNYSDDKTSALENIYVGENVTLSGEGTTKFVGGLIGDSWADQAAGELSLNISNVVFAGNIITAGNTKPGALMGEIQKYAVTVSDFVYYRAATGTGNIIGNFSNNGTLNGKGNWLAAKGELTRCFTIANENDETAMLTDAAGYVVATEKGAMPIKLADMMANYKWQSTAAESGKFDVRIVGEVASLKYDAVGFKVTLYKNGTMDSSKSNVDNDTVYTSVTAASDTVTASAFNTGFMDGTDNKLFVFTLNDLDATATWKIEVVAVYTLGEDVIESAVVRTATVTPAS